MTVPAPATTTGVNSPSIAVGEVPHQVALTLMLKTPPSGLVFVTVSGPGGP
jgi:hypothetical protein